MHRHFHALFHNYGFQTYECEKSLQSLQERLQKGVAMQILFVLLYIISYSEINELKSLSDYFLIV
jgi:hypothetical protein